MPKMNPRDKKMIERWNQALVDLRSTIAVAYDAHTEVSTARAAIQDIIDEYREMEDNIPEDEQISRVAQRQLRDLCDLDIGWSPFGESLDEIIDIRDELLIIELPLPSQILAGGDPE